MDNDVLELVRQDRERLWVRLEEAEAARREVPRRHRSEVRLANLVRREALQDWYLAEKRYQRVLAAYGVIEEAERLVRGPL